MTRSTGTDEPTGSRRPAPEEPSANRLYELRMQRGWTQQDVADRVTRRARDPHTAPTADHVSKWERGKRGISARYRVLLAAVFGVSVDDLGLPSLARGASQTRRDDSLVAMVDQAAELLDQLGDAGHAVRPQVLAALTDEVMSRRSALAFIDTPQPAPTPPSPDELDTLAGQYEAGHRTAAPAALMTALTAHLRMVADALSCGPSTGSRQRLLRNRARVSLLAGQVSQDLDNVMAGRAYYAQAADDGYELGDLAIAALAHGYAARLAVSEGQAAAALRHLDAAGRLDVSDPAIVSWLSGIARHAHGSPAEEAARPSSGTEHGPPARLPAPLTVRWLSGRVAGVGAVLTGAPTSQPASRTGLGRAGPRQAEPDRRAS